VIAIGAYQDDDNGTSSGSVYVCYGSFWGNVVKLTASDGAANDYFGYSVAISGDGSTVVVGAYGDDGAGDATSGSGSVYVYNGSNWGTESKKIYAGDPATGDFFGRSVAVSNTGSTIVVGAPYDDDKGTSSGSIYIYSGTNWGTETKKTTTDGVATDYFGMSVAISSDASTVAASAYGDDDNGLTSGSVYVFNGSSWGTETKLTASDGAANDNLGRSVSVSSNGSIIVVGSHMDDDFDSASGAAYVFSDSGWSTETKITSYDGAGSDYFGFSLAISTDGSTLVAGAYGDDDNGTSSGSAYVIPLE
jgi:hypothetical protein